MLNRYWICLLSKPNQLLEPVCWDRSQATSQCARIRSIEARADHSLIVTSAFNRGLGRHPGAFCLTKRFGLTGWNANGTCRSNFSRSNRWEWKLLIHLHKMSISPLGRLLAPSCYFFFYLAMRLQDFGTNSNTKSLCIWHGKFPEISNWKFERNRKRYEWKHHRMACQAVTNQELIRAVMTDPGVIPGCNSRVHVFISSLSKGKEMETVFS